MDQKSAITAIYSQSFLCAVFLRRFVFQFVRRFVCRYVRRFVCQFVRRLSADLCTTGQSYPPDMSVVNVRRMHPLLHHQRLVWDIPKTSNIIGQWQSFIKRLYRENAVYFRIAMEGVLYYIERKQMNVKRWLNFFATGSIFCTLNRLKTCFIN